MGPRARSSTATLDSLPWVASPTLMTTKKRTHRKLRLLLATGVVGVAAYGAAYRFALRYRERVGLPHRSPVETTPDEFGLAYESVEIPSGDLRLAGWFVPATTDAGATGGTRPGIVIVHGWESNRGRTFAHVRYLHAAGFHCLVFDVRGHGDSPPETLPINVPEFADDTAAAVRWLAARPEVSGVGVLGHSMGGAGVIVAASREPLIRAVVSLSAPADLVRMTRKTFDDGRDAHPRADRRAPGLDHGRRAAGPAPSFDRRRQRARCRPTVSRPAAAHPRRAGPRRAGRASRPDRAGGNRSSRRRTTRRSRR